MIIRPDYPRHLHSCKGARIADHHPLQAFVQAFWNRWQHALRAVGPGVVPLEDDSHAEPLGECSGRPFELAFELFAPGDEGASVAPSGRRAGPRALTMGFVRR